MNMKKTLAGLMAGVVAISAMATVAVSAKAQEAKTKTWTTSWTEKETKTSDATAKVAITLAPKDGDTYAWDTGTIITVNGVQADGQTALTGVKVDKITKIVNRAEGTVEEIKDDVDMYVKVQTTKVDGKTENTNVIEFIGPVPANLKGRTLEIHCEVSAKESIPAAAFLDTDNPTVITTKKNDEAISAIANAPVDAKEEEKSIDKGIVLNQTTGDEVVVIDGIAYTYDLDAAINEQGAAAFRRDNKNTVAGKLAVAEPTEELMDYMADAKGAEITFNFLTKEYKEDSNVDTFNPWADRYEWDATEMKSAISLRVNNSNVLSVAMKDFDKEKFAATYSWDEVMAKFQGGSYTGLVHTLGFKIDNSKLPKDKDGKVIVVELKSITVKVPEMAETEDDTMVEDIVKDFAAGESATVVEDTLPAATDAPAADAPAAPATTDAAANPETGNSAVALLAIPAALAAAAIVAKKRG